LVEGIIGLVRQHRPLHVSLVGGEPLVRHRELSRVLPVLGDMGVHTMVVTSAVIPVPLHWISIPRVRVAVSVDGLPEHHNPRRKPATYERILQNINGGRVNVHWTITRPMAESEGYIDAYLAYWSRQREVVRIWVSLYTPQKGEVSAEVLKSEQRIKVAHELAAMKDRYPKAVDQRRDSPRAAGPAGKSSGVHVLTHVDEPFARPGNARRALHFRGQSGLLAVRMRQQQRPALAEGPAPGTLEGRAHRLWLGGGGRVHGTVPQGVPQAAPVVATAVTTGHDRQTELGNAPDLRDLELGETAVNRHSVDVRPTAWHAQTRRHRAGHHLLKSRLELFHLGLRSDCNARICWHHWPNPPDEDVLLGHRINDFSGWALGIKHEAV